MRRFVNKSSIVQARGGVKPDCPDHLESEADVAPCNTFRLLLQLIFDIISRFTHYSFVIDVAIRKSTVYIDHLLANSAMMNHVGSTYDQSMNDF